MKYDTFNIEQKEKKWFTITNTNTYVNCKRKFIYSKN